MATDVGRRAVRETPGMLRTVKARCGPPIGTGFLPAKVWRLLDAHGGIVSTRELDVIEIYPTLLEILRDYGALQAVRQGWHCAPELPAVIRLAWRFGGPLACTSALEFHQALENNTPLSELSITQPMHVCLPSNAPRVPSPQLLARRWGIPVPDAPIIHWSTRDHRSGTRSAVSLSRAVAQAARCTAVRDSAHE